MADRTGRTEGIASMAAYLAFWAVVVAVAKREHGPAWPRRPLSPRGAGRRGRTTGDPALEALRVRYARGDVDRDTYLAMRSDLTVAGASDRPS